MGKIGNSDRFYFLGLQNHCRPRITGIKLRRFPLGRKAMSNLDSILKNRENTLPTKAHIVKAMVFLVIMCGCESWSIKKAECQRINAFKMWCWRRLLRVPCTARRSNQWILKEINHEYSLEGLMLIAEAPILWPPDAKSGFIGQYPDPGKDWRQEEKRAREDKMVGWHHYSMYLNLSKSRR